MNNHLEVVTFLLSKGANLNSATKVTFYTVCARGFAELSSVSMPVLACMHASCT